MLKATSWADFSAPEPNKPLPHFEIDKDAFMAMSKAELEVWAAENLAFYVNVNDTLEANLRHLLRQAVG